MMRALHPNDFFNGNNLHFLLAFISYAFYLSAIEQDLEKSLPVRTFFNILTKIISSLIPHSIYEDLLCIDPVFP